MFSSVCNKGTVFNDLCQISGVEGEWTRFATYCDLRVGHVQPEKWRFPMQGCIRGKEEEKKVMEKPTYISIQSSLIRHLSLWDDYDDDDMRGVIPWSMCFLFQQHHGSSQVQAFLIFPFCRSYSHWNNEKLFHLMRSRLDGLSSRHLVFCFQKSWKWRACQRMLWKGWVTFSASLWMKGHFRCSAFHTALLCR